MSAYELLAVDAFSDGREHLHAELELLDLRLRRQVMRLRAAHLLTEDQFRGLYISDEQVDVLLRERAPEDGLTAAALTRRIEESRAMIRARAEAAAHGGIALPIRTLQQRCDLGGFETELLIIAAAPELDLRYQTIYAYAQNDVTRRGPAADFALHLLCSSLDERLDRRAALRPGAPLVRNRLLRLGEDAQEKDVPLLARPLRTDPRVVEFLVGSDAVDPLLHHALRRIEPRTALDDLVLPQELRARIANMLPRLASEAATVVIEGRRGTGRKSIAESICAALGMPMLLASSACIASLADGAHLLRREALLSGGAIVIDHFERLTSDDATLLRRSLASELSMPGRPLLLITSQPWTPDEFRGESLVFAIEVPPPDAAARLALWNRATNEHDAAANLASKYALSGGQIRDAVHHANAAAALRGGDVEARDLEEGAQAQSSLALRTLAQKIEPKHQWNDLVLPPKQLQQLRDVCVSLRYRGIVYDDWGFQARVVSGRGLTVLFTGPSGTGKTMAASIVARELGLTMYRVDLSAVVSKYIGETEKNLSRIFAEAESGNAILFFDEADALFGKRSEVKDAHDRYANIEIAYLLQRIETYDGPVILATNFGRNIDDAFARRMHHTIDFPFPDAQHRERIWRGLMPAGAPVADDVDLAFLARQFELAGGNIRNVVVAAAFHAASEQSAIAMRHMIAATARELQKIGRLPSRVEFREYYELVRDAGTAP